MNKYIIVKTSGGGYHLATPDKVFFIPEGWRQPYDYHHLLSNMTLSKAKRAPAHKTAAQVRINGLLTNANNARLVDEATCYEIDDIDAQILELRRRRAQIIRDRYLTFPLVEGTELEMSRDKVYATKAAAEQAKGE